MDHEGTKNAKAHEEELGYTIDVLRAFRVFVVNVGS
jgi:hypothetical protein